MSPSSWSDEERWFVPRRFGLGYSINFKHLARKLGWIKPIDEPTPDPAEMPGASESREDRLKRAVERSRYEDG